MSRIILATCCLLSLATTAVAADSKGPAYDWSAWERIPVLDDGRIKPLDTFADEVVVLVTGRQKWTDPETQRKYFAPELLYCWITGKDEWRNKPVIRCEYRPLRKELLGADKEQGTFIAVNDFIDWERSKKEATLIFRNEEVQKRFRTIEKETRGGKKSPSDVGENIEERKLNGKAAELVKHTMAFLRASEARNLFVVPGLDPRVLTKQFDTDSKLQPWIPLSAILRLDDWRSEGDVTVAAIMAPGPEPLFETISEMQLYSRDEIWYLPQLFQALKLQNELRPEFEAVKAALDKTRDDYDGKEGHGPQEFARSMRIFVSKLETLAHDLVQARTKMGPLENGPEGYKPLELDARQMALSAYPAPGALDVEIRYNRTQPFYLAVWIYGLAAIPLLASWILGLMDVSLHKWAKFFYISGLGVTAAAILFASYGFALRILVAGRPPVTNMYETVIWVSYVVSVMGLWFGTLPLVWPGLQWSWRLTAIPGSWEDTTSADDDRTRMFERWKKPIGMASTILRLAGCIGLVLFLTQFEPIVYREHSFKIISLTPPVTGVKSISITALLTWLIGIATVLSASWVLPRVALTLVGGLITVIPEGRRVGAQLWEQTFARRFFLIGSIPVALFGMLLAYHVGNVNTEILNPRIGSISAVLRDNYWLTIHVLTIVSSYAAGALVWGLGNLAMLYYLFGRYRRIDTHAESIADKVLPARDVAAPIFSEKELAGHPEKSDTILSRLKTAGGGLMPGQIRQTFSSGLQGFGTGDQQLEKSLVRPPHDVVTLAGFGYKGMQVAVLLLAAGTILGGLWADVSWGRFWDWDPKEVWALISLLVYLVFLHGRYAGVVGTFGTNVGSVLCFQVIMMSWYGVNFILPMFHGWWNGTGSAVPMSVGLHSYGAGAGGTEYVVGACALNIVLVILAWARYTMETKVLGSPSHHPAPQLAETQSIAEAAGHKA